MNLIPTKLIDIQHNTIKLDFTQFGMAETIEYLLSITRPQRRTVVTKVIAGRLEAQFTLQMLLPMPSRHYTP